MTLPTAFEKRNVPVRFVSITLFHCSSRISSTGAPQDVPALLIKMSIRPKLETVASTTACTSLEFFTSQPRAKVFTPTCLNSSAACSQRSFLRAQSTTLAPISAKPSAIWRPSPTEPPVMIATRPLRSSSFLIFIRNSRPVQASLLEPAFLGGAGLAPWFFPSRKTAAPFETRTCGQRPGNELCLERNPKKPVRLPPSARRARRMGRAQKSAVSLSSDCVKRAKILAWIKWNVRWRNCNDALWRPENVESRSQRSRGIVQVCGIDILPFSGIQAVEQRLNCSDGFRRREGTVSRAIDKRAAQEFRVARFIDDTLVGAFILNHHQAIALGVQRQHRKMDLAVKDNIRLQVTNRLGIRTDPRRIVQRLQIGVEVEARLLVKRANLVAANRVLQLHPVIDSRVPGDIALCAGLQFRTKRKYKGKVHLLIPQKLVGLLAGKIGWRRLR